MLIKNAGDGRDPPQHLTRLENHPGSRRRRRPPPERGMACFNWVELASDCLNPLSPHESIHAGPPLEQQLAY